MHVREQIREAAKIIVSGSTEVADRVVIGRVKPVERGSAMSAGVYTTTEVTREITTDGKQQRVITLRIDAAAKGDEPELLARLDDFAVYVETEFANEPTVGDTASTSEYRGTTGSTNIDGEKPFSVISLMFELTVFTDKTDPETILR